MEEEVWGDKVHQLQQLEDENLHFTNACAAYLLLLFFKFIIYLTTGPEVNKGDMLYFKISGY